ncbi:hypothetical protein V8E53_015881 [Lactarius tabidus]
MSSLVVGDGTATRWQIQQDLHATNNQISKPVFTLDTAVKICLICPGYEQTEKAIECIGAGLGSAAIETKVETGLRTNEPMASKLVQGNIAFRLSLLYAALLPRRRKLFCVLNKPLIVRWYVAVPIKVFDQQRSTEE